MLFSNCRYNKLLDKFLKLNLFNVDTRRKWLSNLPSQGLVLKDFDDYL